MKSEIASLIDEKAEQLPASAKRKRDRVAIGGGIAAGLCTTGALIAGVPTETVLVVEMSLVLLVLVFPCVLTYGGGFRLRGLIRANRMIEAQRMSQKLMAQSLSLFPYSALYFVATLQLDLMLRQAAYHEVDAMSRLLRGAIERYPYLPIAKRRLMPLFDNYQGLAYLGLGEHEPARKLFSECLANASRVNKSVFFNNVAVCDLHLMRFEEAYAGFKKAIEATVPAMRASFVLPRLNPNLARACIRLGKLDEAGDLLTQSAQYFDKSTEDNVNRANFYKSLGLLKMEQGQYDEAEQHLRSSIELQHQVDDLHPTLQDTRLELANVFEKVGRESEAAALRKLVAENTLKLQLRLEDASDELERGLLGGSHPILLLAK